ncbi:hypothetical protein [Lentzea sp. NPDC004782]|uniref:hypothetical protein n=1 Tax=Lentzea sp. NPDC004782 TaxID=3154458 RepID=UPI0033BB052C
MRRVVLVLLLLVAVASCGRNQSEGNTLLCLTSTAQPKTTPMNDPALAAAAHVVQPLLESKFASTYAGLEMRNDVPMMVVYRKPDPSLDAEVRQVAPGVRIEFRDARYTRAEMGEYVKRVMDDTQYWKGRGISITSAGPEVDGSGVQVGVVAPPPGNFARYLDEHYPAMSFKLQSTGEIVPLPYTGSVPVIPTT